MSRRQPNRSKSRPSSRKLRCIAVLAACVAAITVTACGEDDSEAPPSKPSPDDGLLVTYSRGGGIAGVDEQLEVDTDGSARFHSTAIPMDADGDAPIGTGGSEGEAKEFTLGDSELANLKDLLAAASDEFTSPDAAPPPTGCADCFVYAVDAGGMRLVFDDVSLDEAPASVQELITELGRLAAT